MTDLTLGVLDQCPIHEGGPPSRGLEDATTLAAHCERLGYHRYWVAEHHATPGYACPAPEIMVAHLAARTSRMRVGTGGVMLTHYAPFKVAEQFRMLSALHPGRIDLGIGRAPGGDGRAVAALAAPRQPIDPRLYGQQAWELAGYLRGDLPAEHPFRDLPAMPSDAPAPELWMLGSSGGSADLAGQLGMGFVLAMFIGTHDRTPAIMDGYRAAFAAAWPQLEPRSMLAVTAICADDHDHARRVAATRSLWIHRGLYHRRMGPLPSPEEAAREEAAMDADERAHYQRILDNTVFGTPAECRRQIVAQAAEYAVDEVLVMAVTYHLSDRLRSYELLAEAFDLPGRARARALAGGA